MSHDETSGPVTRKERRKAYGGGRKPVTRRPFSAADHICHDWTPEDLTEFLEERAVGYNGLLRNFLCTAAHQLRAAGAEIDRLEGELLDERGGGFAEEDEAEPAPKPDTMIRAGEDGS